MALEAHVWYHVVGEARTRSARLYMCLDMSLETIYGSRSIALHTFAHELMCTHNGKRCALSHLHLAVITLSDPLPSGLLSPLRKTQAPTPPRTVMPTPTSPTPASCATAWEWPRTARPSLLLLMPLSLVPLPMAMPIAT